MRGESARPGKRPLRALSAAEKMDAIQRVHEGESKASVARDIGVPESTLRGWCKSEHKIRGMARNSSTPDSEAHSPASSSALTGGANATSNSEDEAVGPSPPKRMRSNDDSLPIVNDNNGYKTSDYVSLLNSLVAGGSVRPEQSALLLQQLGLLQSASLTKNLMGLGGGLGATSSHTVGLVENGLQYTKNNSNIALTTNNNCSNISHKRSSTTSPHISAIAPTSQESAKRKSLPPAAEAPLTPVPASPRRTSEQLLHNGSKKDHHNLDKSYDKDLYMWLAQQQQQFLGQTVAPFSPQPSLVDGSWFWQFYKKCGFPVAQTTNSTILSQQDLNKQQEDNEALEKRKKYKTSIKKSPSKAKAIIDNVLSFNNNNNNYNESENKSVKTIDDESPEDLSESSDKSITLEEALEHAKVFKKWLEKCSEPSVTQLQIIQFKYLVDSLQKKLAAPAYSKHSRK